MSKKSQYVKLGMFLPVAMSIGTVAAIYAFKFSTKSVAMLISVSFGVLLGLAYLLVQLGNEL